MIRRYGKLALFQTVGNMLLLLLLYYWLGIGESRAVALAWSLLVAVLWIALACWVHGAGFSWFARKDDGASAAFRTALRHLPALFVFALLTLFLYYLAGQLYEYASGPAARMAVWLTLRLQKPVKPASILKIVGVVLWVVRWVVLPVLLIPLFSGLSVHGLRGLGKWRPKWIYWLEAPLLLLATLWLPLKLLGWVPQLGGFGLEMTSFLLRLVLAYALFVAGCMALQWITASMRPAGTSAQKPAAG